MRRRFTVDHGRQGVEDGIGVGEVDAGDLRCKTGKLLEEKLNARCQRACMDQSHGIRLTKEQEETFCLRFGLDK